MNDDVPEIKSGNIDELVFDDVSHTYGKKRIFHSVSGSVAMGSILIVSGANGSGKSTLLRMLAGLIKPATGSITLNHDNVKYSSHDYGYKARVGLAAPDIQLYGNLSGVENLLFFASLRGKELEKPDLVNALESVGLLGRGRDLVSTYSSGMRQRLKLAVSSVTQAPLWFLDEPTANLDVNGIQIVEALVQSRQSQCFTVIATNEPRELEWSKNRIVLGDV